MRSRLPAVVSWFVLAISAGSVLGQEDTSWVGKTVIVKRPGVKIAAQPAPPPFADLPGIDYRVRAESNGWIRVTTSHGAEGWFEKKHAVPIEDAAEHFSELIRNDPSDADAFACRSVAYRWSKDLDRALQDIQEAIRLDPRSSAWRSNRAMLWAEKGQHDQALRDFDEAIRLAPKSGIAYHGRANAHYARQDYESAIRDYGEAIALNSRFLLGYLHRGNARYLKKDYDQAIKDYEEALQLDPRFEIAYHNRGNAWFAKREFDKAIEDYTETLRLLPTYAPAYNHRGASYYYKKDYIRALADYRKALELDPQYASAWNGLAWLLATCPDAGIRNGAEAFQAARKARDISSESTPKTREIWAAVHAELGEFDRAVRFQQEALTNVGYVRIYGEEVRQRLELYRNNQPYRDR